MLNYAIVGGGRLARHFSEYFRLLGVPHSRWTRDRRSSFNTFELPDAGLRLRETIANADRILLLVSDNAIATLLKQYPFLYEKPLIHCSGALSFPGIAAAHPLMTFADGLYGLETYQSVPFVLEAREFNAREGKNEVHEAGSGFSELFPALPNPYFSVNPEDRARYHALCVMAGNFTQILWAAVSDRFEQQFEWPTEILHAYLNQVAGNFIQTPESALTGPLVRNDYQTIERNIDSLSGDPLQDLYHAFHRFYQSDKRPVPRLNQAQMEAMA